MATQKKLPKTLTVKFLRNKMHACTYGADTFRRATRNGHLKLTARNVFRVPETLVERFSWFVYGIGGYRLENRFWRMYHLFNGAFLREGISALNEGQRQSLAKKAALVWVLNLPE